VEQMMIITRTQTVDSLGEAEAAGSLAVCPECGKPITPADEGVCAECTERTEHEEEGRR
jgi:predicted amidophosphoribosyltransferase